MILNHNAKLLPPMLSFLLHAILHFSSNINSGSQFNARGTAYILTWDLCLK